MLAVFASNVVLGAPEYVVGTETFAVTITPVCSGFEGIGLLGTFMGAYIGFARGQLQWPRALVLVPAGMLAAWVANVLRISALIGVGHWLSPETAIGAFHSKAGWVLYCAAALGLVAWSHRSRMLARQPSEPTDKLAHVAAPYLAPLLGVVAASLVTGLFAGAVDVLYPARVLAGGSLLWAYRATLQRELTWRGSPRAMLLAAALGAAVFAIWIALAPAAHQDSASALRSELDSMSPLLFAIWIGFRIAGAVLVVPVAEELAFRGYVLRRLIDKDFTRVAPGAFSWPSFLVSSATFGALHQHWLGGLLAGMVYALAVYRRGRLADAVLAHAVTNAILAAYVCTTGNWHLW